MIFFLSPRQRQYIMFFTTTWQGFGTVFYELFLTRHGRSVSTFFQSIKMYNDNFITCDTLIQYGHKHEHENVQECGHDPGQYIYGQLGHVHKQVNVQEQCMHNVYGYIRTCIQTCTQTTTGL